MKIIFKWFVFLLPVLLVAIALTADDTPPTEPGKLKADAQAAAEKTRDTVKDAVEVGKLKAGEMATNVASEVKIGVQKARVVATNVVATVEAGAQRAGEVATNVLDQVKEKVKDITQ